MIRIKRVYDPPSAGDGLRVLVDRLWPRGLSREKAGIDAWDKEIAPSDGLRRWFAHDPAKWTEFQARYRKELQGKPERIRAIRKLAAGKKIVTLVFGSKDERRNNAVVLARALV